MTAEIAVLNRSGVALAADSAVTTGGGKIYSSVDKLFNLSVNAPVGIMIYGNADFVGIPWETTIKTYRQNLGPRRFRKLSLYAADFQRFLRSSRALFPGAHQDDDVRNLITEYLFQLRDMMLQGIEEAVKSKNGPLAKNEVLKIIDETISFETTHIGKHPKIRGLRNKRGPLRIRFGTFIRGQCAHIFGNLPMSAASKNRLLSLPISTLCCTHSIAMDSGFVIAGFGEAEFMPSILAFAIEGMALNSPRCWPLESDAGITLKNAATVLPFAQREMVQSFMEGIDPTLLGFMEDSTTWAFDGAMARIFGIIQKTFGKTHANQIRAKVRPKVEKLVTSMLQSWEARRREYWFPVLEAVAALPKDELAAMAETLVNLTKFRRRVTPDQETVGGPIDVAVISKGDGFVWVRRKHYFDPALNPRVIARYTHGG